MVYREHKQELTFLLILVFLSILLGSVFYHFVEGLGYTDSFYFSAMTLTTVGYGDIVPLSSFGKLFTVFYSLVGIGILFGFFNTISKIRLTMSLHHIRENEKKNKKRN